MLLDDRFQNLFDAECPAWPKRKMISSSSKSDEFADFVRDALGIGVGQIDFVDHRDDREVCSRAR